MADVLINALLAYTVPPLAPLAVFPEASLASTVRLNAVPAVGVAVEAETTNAEATVCLTVTLVEVPFKVPSLAVIVPSTSALVSVNVVSDATPLENAA